ncbi:MAG: hypothetical protein ACI8YI_001702, partial [Paracoccaceae bacterium]
MSGGVFVLGFDYLYPVFECDALDDFWQLIF